MPKILPRLYFGLFSHEDCGILCLGVLLRSECSSSKLSFILWQQTTMEITHRTYSITACLRHIHIGAILSEQVKPHHLSIFNNTVFKEKIWLCSAVMFCGLLSLFEKNYR